MSLQTTSKSPSPLCINSNARLDSVDMLRGIALFGVFITHIICQFYGLSFPKSPTPPVITTPFDSALDKVLAYFLFDKARGMFSFLFGVGFYLQLFAASKTGISLKGRFIKRFSILLIFGILHYYFLFKGDVLRYYAILGMVLLLCYQMKPKVLLAGSVMLAIVAPAICCLFPNDLFIGDFNTPMFITIFGHFLFGLWVAQKKILQNISAYQLQIREVFIYSVCINVVCFLIRAGLKTAELKGLIVISPAIDNVLGTTFLIGNQALLLAILCGIPLLFLNHWWKGKLALFVTPGRMTLTNYLAQSVIAIVFYKLGIFTLLGTGALFVTSILLCIFQLYFSKIWLSYFRTGPCEWLWRSATKLTWAPKRSVAPTIETKEIKRREAPLFIKSSFSKSTTY